MTSGTWALYTVILKRCPQNFVQSEWGDIYDTRRVRMDGWAEESKNAKRLDESYSAPKVPGAEGRLGGG